MVRYGGLLKKTAGRKIVLEKFVEFRSQCPIRSTGFIQIGRAPLWAFYLRSFFKDAFNFIVLLLTLCMATRIS